MARASLEKDPRDVKRMFDAVGKNYDITNTVLSFGRVGSAMPRVEFDNFLLKQALAYSEVTFRGGVAATNVAVESQVIRSVELADGTTIYPRYVIVADGVRSPFGKLLGRTWHRDEVYAIAARSYCNTPRSHEPWIHSHLELRTPEGEVQPGYGWIFPLGNGTANVGCGALSTAKRPARVNTKKLLQHYAGSCAAEWEFDQPRQVTSALLPMGGAVSGVAGKNFALIGDAAAGVNPLNGEGIDYALEHASLIAPLIDAQVELSQAWPHELRRAYGAAFALARSAAKLLTYPQFLPLAGPIALGKPFGSRIMPTAARLMGNLVTEEDTDLLARAWRFAGRTAESEAARRSRPLWS